MSGAQPTDKLARLEEDVRDARSELATTVDQLAGWFDPKTRATAAVDRGRRMLHDAADPTADPAVRRRARIVLALVAAGAAAAVAGLAGRRARR
jgi:Na+(H+)/acetate symporter ActP